MKMSACDRYGKELNVGDMVTITYRSDACSPLTTLTAPIAEIFYYSGLYRIKLPYSKTKTGKVKYIRFMALQVEKVS